MASRGELSFDAPIKTTFPPTEKRLGQPLIQKTPFWDSLSITPAITESADLLETLGLQHVGKSDQSGNGGRKISRSLHEFLEVLSVLVILGWHFFSAARIPLPEKIGHEHLSAHALGQDISSL
jgi:hypothetical protein